MPALLTNTSSPPKFSTVSFIMFSTLASSDTFANTARAGTPHFSEIASAVLFAPSRFMSAITTDAPALARYSAIPAPNPCALPVTMAILPLRGFTAPCERLTFAR